jgi:hypothetical protein
VQAKAAFTAEVAFFTSWTVLAHLVEMSRTANEDPASVNVPFADQVVF